MFWQVWVFGQGSSGSIHPIRTDRVIDRKEVALTKPGRHFLNRIRCLPKSGREFPSPPSFHFTFTAHASLYSI
jgi:hypothetical protein